MHAFSKKKTFFLKPFLLTIFLDICYSLNPQNVQSIVLIQDILEKLKVENSSSRHPNGPKMFAFIHNIHIYIYIYIVCFYLYIVCFYLYIVCFHFYHHFSPDILHFGFVFFPDFKLFIFISIQRIDNVVVVSREQERDPVIHKHVSILSNHPLLPYPGQHKTLSTVRLAKQWVFGYSF